MARSDTPSFGSPADDLDIDPVLEARIRDTLRAVADTTPSAGFATDAQTRPAEDDADGRLGAAPSTIVGLAAPLPEHGRRTGRASARQLLAVAAALVVAVGAVAVLQGNRASQTTLPAQGTGATLPAGFDRATATPVFSGAGDERAVAQAYLDDRFPDRAPIVDGTDRGDGFAHAEWRVVEDVDGSGASQAIASGDVLMREIDGGWAVVAATTDGLDLSTLSYDGERVRGSAFTASPNSLFADVLTPAGEPVRHAPRPDGFTEESSFRFGTAAGPGRGALPIDVEHRRAPAVVRITMIGGTMLSIAELRFDPPALASHRDYDACMQQHLPIEKEPAPDEVERQCAAALEGQVLASGSTAHRQWQLVASDEPSGSWVTLRGDDIVRVMRFNGPGPRSVEELGADGFLIGDHTGVAVVVSGDAERVRVTTADGTAVEAPAVTDARSGLTVAILTLPGTSVGSVRLEVQVAGAYRLITDEMSVGGRGG